MEAVKQEIIEIPEGYKKSKYGIIPDDWKIVKVKDVLKRVRKPVNIIKEDRYKQIGIRSHGKGIFYKEEVTGEELGNKAVFWIEPDCFIVNIVFAWELAVARTTNNELGYIASHRFPMYKPVDNKLDLDFITYLFKSRRGKHLLNLASPGGAGRNKTLGQKEFGELDILIPSNIKEQKKIAEILLTWDMTIELKEKLIEKKKEQKKGLMQKLLTGKVRLPGFGEDWKKIKLGDVGEFLKGKGISKNDIIDKGINSIRYGEIYTSHHFYIKEFYSFINREVAEGSTKIKMNDLLFAGSGESAEEIGKAVAYVDNKEAYAGGDIIILRPQVKVDSLFLSYVVNVGESAKQRAKLAQGNSIVHIYPSNLSKISLLLPPYVEQQAIANLLKSFDREIDLLQKEVKQLTQQKKGLIQLLLTGKVRVKV